jgi:hypothetical protein
MADGLKLKPLSPLKSAEDIDGPREALAFAFDKTATTVKVKDEHGVEKVEKYLPILNIALTGGYGTGKSSVIETFKAQHTGLSFIHLAFTQFQPHDDKDTENVLEAKILNQLIHQVPAHRIPRTRFPVKRTLGSLKETVIAISTFLVAFAVFVVGNHYKKWFTWDVFPLSEWLESNEFTWGTLRKPLQPLPKYDIIEL